LVFVLEEFVSTHAVVFVALLTLAAPVAAQDRSPMVGELLVARQVTTSGQSEVSLAPDQAWVTVGIEQRAPASRDAQRLAAEVMTRIRGQLAALGIPEAAIRTVSFNLHADWQFAANKRSLRGYVVTNLLQVRVDDITKVGDVLDRSISAGGNAIRGVRWDIKDRVAVERDALRQAVEDAKRRAEVAVAAAGATLGPVATITEHRIDSRQAEMVYGNLADVAVETQTSTPISPGELTVRANVVVAFRIL
jgi:uncharacterized protein YggE